MDNIDVVNFVERYKTKAVMRPPERIDYPIKPTSTTISHLLCEEARYRWFGIIEDEDVMTDDISVIVIEMKSIHSSLTYDETKLGRRQTDRPHSLSDIKQVVGNEVKLPRRTDPHRGSFIPANQVQAVVRRDPTRGSVVSPTTRKSLDDSKIHQLYKNEDSSKIHDLSIEESTLRHETEQEGSISINRDRHGE